MKITEVEAIVLRQPVVDGAIADGSQDDLIVRIHTDEGIVGVGEVDSAPEVVRAVFDAPDSHYIATGLRHVLIGQDPLLIEHHWNYLYRWNAFRGAAIMGALSAIDIALWDIAGKHYGVPAYKLLGGPTRQKARVYYHVFGQTREQLVQGCIDAKAKGFTAVGHLTPFTDDPRDRRYFKTHASKIGDAVETLPAACTDEPEHRTSAREIGRRLHAALTALPPLQRDAFLLSHQSELTLAEIATLTGVGIETVKSRVRYAIDKLRAALGELREVSD